MSHPVVRDIRFFLAHTPGLVRHGSKPTREIHGNHSVWQDIQGSLRSFDEAAAYAPHQVLLGNMKPDDLNTAAAPWYENMLAEYSTSGPHGELVNEDQFHGLLKAADEFDLVLLEEGYAARVAAELRSHPRVTAEEIERIQGVPYSRIEERLTSREGAIPLFTRDGETVGLVQTDYVDDASLAPDILLENLAVKATATMALRSVLAESGTDPASLQYVIGSGEEAIGDRYNRGGGNLGKAVAEAAACASIQPARTSRRSAALPSMRWSSEAASSNRASFPGVAVVGGCSLAKLGMKFRGHLAKEIPVMEDVLAGFAVLMGPDDGTSPVLRLDSVGRHTVGAGSVQQAIVEALVSDPLDRLGLKFGDVAKYATEMHNPEITDTAGSGNVPRTNYRLIAALAAQHGEIPKGSESRDKFVEEHGMPGFSPTQGHVASAMPFMAHALDDLRAGDYQYSMFLAKGSLFLGRMTHMSDGESFIMESNSGAG